MRANNWGLVSPGLLDELWGEFPRVPRAGIRNAVREIQGCARIAESAGVRAVVRAILGGDAFVTRSILFDKTREANWSMNDAWGWCARRR